MTVMSWSSDRPHVQITGRWSLPGFKEEAEEIPLRFYSEGDYVRLQPANSTMDPIYALTENIEVRGKVVGMIRNLG